MPHPAFGVAAVAIAVTVMGVTFGGGEGVTPAATALLALGFGLFFGLAVLDLPPLFAFVGVSIGALLLVFGFGLAFAFRVGGILGGP